MFNGDSKRIQGALGAKSAAMLGCAQIEPNINRKYIYVIRMK